MAKQVRSAAKRRKFIEALASGATVSAAAKAAGVDRALVYRERKADSDFRANWDAAIEEGTDLLLGEARRRAVEGTEKPVHYKGGPVLNDDGAPLVVREYSDTLLIFLLKSRDPERYCDRARMATIQRKWQRQDAKRAAESTDKKGDSEALAYMLGVLADIAAAKAAMA